MPTETLGLQGEDGGPDRAWYGLLRGTPILKPRRGSSHRYRRLTLGKIGWTLPSGSFRQRVGVPRFMSRLLYGSSCAGLEDSELVQAFRIG